MVAFPAIRHHSDDCRYVSSELCHLVTEAYRTESPSRGYYMARVKLLCLSLLIQLCNCIC